MQQRRGTAAQWISTNSGNGPILAAGEIGFESDTNKFKIGDGVNHWVDLTYFTDAEAAIASITDLVDGAPDLLNTLNELAAALGDDASFATNITNMINGVEQQIADHAGETTSVHGIADASLLATMLYVDSAVSNSTVDQSALAGTGIDWNATTEQFDIDETVATTEYVGLHASDTTNIHGIEDTAELATKTYADDAVSAHDLVTLDVHGIADTSALATKTFAANLLLEATKTNISITGDIDGLTISAENGVADSDTDDLAEGVNHLYFTDERAQDAIGNLVGTGLTYTDATGEIAVDTAVIQERVADVSDAEIGYLNGVTSSIQTQLDAKSTDLSNHSSDTTNIHGIADTSLLATTANVATAKQEAIDAAAVASENYTDGAIGSLTKSSVGLANVDNTADADKPVSTAAQTALDAKLSLAGGTMTGALTLSGAPTSDLQAATKIYVDNIAAGINFHAAAHAATTANLAADYNNGTNGIGATLTSTTNGTWTTLDGHTSFTQYDRILVKNQADAKQNGIYILSDLGSGSSKWILTRSSDSDNNPSGEMKNGDFTFVQNGTVNASVGFINNSTANPIVIGTDNITYTEFNAAKTIVAGNGLVEATPGVLSIDTSITQARVSGVSDTEIGYLDGVTSAIQTQLDSKLATSTAASTYAPINSPTFTGTVAGVTKSMVGLGNVDNTSDANKPISSATQAALDTKASSLAVIDAETASYTLILSNKDQVVEMNVGSANTVTVPADSSVNFPIGTQIDILQVGSGQTTVVAGSEVTINATPGLKLRTQWAGATLRKRAANTWVLVGDLTA